MIIVIPATAIGEGVAVRNSSSISVIGSTWNYLTFDSELWDNKNFHSTSSNTSRLTIPSGTDGWYQISGAIEYSGSSPSSSFFQIILNRSTVIYEQIWLSTDWSLDASTVYYLSAGQYIELRVYPNSNATIASYANYSPEFRMVRISGETLCGIPVDCTSPARYDQYLQTKLVGESTYSWDVVSKFHAISHQDGGNDEINVGGLSGILTDTQDAGWLQGYPITLTPPTLDYGLIWNGSYWEPAQISGTGGYTMPDMITATISGTVPVVITSTWQLTESLSSGSDIAILRSFTYGEASIAIGLFIVAAMLGLNFVMMIQRK